ncbi:MAG: hypothetical protein UHH87_03980 [Akkermansia sp.]|nr:hypothetical protein [Akkermansia sp.]
MYYNYRHYNPVEGKWIGRDIINSYNMYKFLSGAPYAIDILGGFPFYLALGGFIYVGAVGYVALRRHMDDLGEQNGKDRVYAPNAFYGVKLYKKIGDRLSALHYSRIVYDREEFNDLLKEVHIKSACKCIKEITVAVHGCYESDTQKSSITFGSEDLNEENIVHMFAEVKFCGSCKIEIRSCHIGKSASLRKSLSKYKCEVILYNEKVSAI